MKLDYFLIIYSDEPLENKWTPIGVLVHDGKKMHLRMAGVKNRDTVDLAPFASISPKAAANDWVYREWVDWVYSLIEEKQSLDFFQAELEELAGTSSNFTIVEGGTIEVAANPDYSHMCNYLYEQVEAIKD